MVQRNAFYKRRFLTEFEKTKGNVSRKATTFLLLLFGVAVIQNVAGISGPSQTTHNGPGDNALRLTPEQRRRFLLAG